jgi:hypothetical protein
VKSFWNFNSNRWVVLALVFVIGPAGFYLIFIHSPLQQIIRFENLVNTQSDRSLFQFLTVVPADNQELEQLKTIKENQLARIKRIDSQKSLLQFNSILADAIALQARKYDLRVAGVEMKNPLIAGRYIPDNVRALDMLESIPGVQWDEIHDPLALPMLNLPSIELQITVSGEYSQVFSYVESLSAFPARILLSGLSMMEGSDGKYYCLIIRGFYYDAGKEEHLAQTDTMLDSEEVLFK